MSAYEHVMRWSIPALALSDSIAEMAPDGREGNESIVLWAGTSAAGVARVTHLIGLHGPLIKKRPLQMIIAPDLFAKVSLFCGRRKLILLGQIHSHPGEFTDLSDVDRKYGIATPCFLSIVAPHYAQRSDTTWQECGVHVFEEGFGFRRMSQTEARTRVLVDQAAQAPLERLN